MGTVHAAPHLPDTSQPPVSRSDHTHFTDDETRLREMERAAQSHTVRRWQGWDLRPEGLLSRLVPDRLQICHLSRWSLSWWKSCLGLCPCTIQE